jgi:cobalt/nickel transport system permease protein
MGAGHGHKLHFHGHSWLHRAPAEWKLVGLVSLMVVVVATPAQVYPAFGVYAAGLVLLAASARVPASYLAQRMLIETPVVAWGTLAKATLGVFAGLLLAATTEPRALLAGLTRLKLPAQLVLIMTMMIRYLDVVTDEWRRMQMGRTARGFSARNPRHWPVLAKSLGVLFIRSYERGERVHLAMLSRGFDGTLP